MIKIVLVDDHELVRTGIARLLNDVKDFSIIASFGSGEEVIDFCRDDCPDLVLMDVSMPGIGGLEATKKIKRMCEGIKVLCLSMYSESPFPTKVMQAGAHGFITKDAEQKEMVDAIYTVMSGQKYVAPDIAQKIALGQIDEESANPFEALSNREIEIMLMLTKGVKTSDIALSLNISPKTVNTYRYRMFDKLNIESDVELTHLALRYNLIKTPA